MLTTDLRRFEPFACLPPDALRAVAECARELRLPARRWVVRPGGQLPGECYLRAGRVRLVARAGTGAVVSSDTPRARQAIYPGAWGVESLTEVTLVYLDPAALVLPWQPQAAGRPELESAEDSWQHRFLSSPLMQRLSPAAWQRVLRAMQLESHEAGARVIRAGDAADCCYVLCAGSAQVSRGARVLARLGPGDFFGEDALITLGRRNAGVRMLEAGATMRLGAAEFEAWLLQPVVQPLDRAGDRVPLHLGERAPAGRLAVELHEVRELAARLSPLTAYVVVGASLERRMLAAFVLAQRGLDARPLLR